MIQKVTVILYTDVQKRRDAHTHTDTRTYIHTKKRVLYVKVDADENVLNMKAY